MSAEYILNAEASTEAAIKAERSSKGRRCSFTAAVKVVVLVLVFDILGLAIVCVEW